MLANLSTLSDPAPRTQNGIIADLGLILNGHSGPYGHIGPKFGVLGNPGTGMNPRCRWQQLRSKQGERLNQGLINTLHNQLRSAQLLKRLPHDNYTCITVNGRQNTLFS